jgi:hypothetical protein
MTRLAGTAHMRYCFAVSSYEGLRASQLKELQSIVEERQDEIKKAWKQHFAR